MRTQFSAGVEALVTYPVKGCAGLPVTSSVVSRAGLAHDRAFKIVDADGHALTQRHVPRLAIIQPSLDDAGTSLTLRAGEDVGLGSLTGEVVFDGGRRATTLFGQAYTAVDQGDAFAAWLTEVLRLPARLVRVPPDHTRVTDGAVAGTSRFADSCAVHLLSTASLAHLNRRLTENGASAVPVNRFRPNIVLSGLGEPHAEDGIHLLEIGDLVLEFAKPAIRCVVTTVDQRGGRTRGHEPLRTLATYRRTPDGLAFGTKLVVARPGTLRVGDELRCSAVGADEAADEEHARFE